MINVSRHLLHGTGGVSSLPFDDAVEEDGTDRTAAETRELTTPVRHGRAPAPDAPSRHVEVRRRAAHYAGLVLASIVGCLIRLGLEAMADYEGRAIFALAWAQGVGCGIMGLALSRKSELTELYPPLYTFITTGVAGSVTTFSSWVLKGYQAFANSEGVPRSVFHCVVDGFAYSFATFAIAIGCLYWGEHVSQCLPPVAHLSHSQRRKRRRVREKHDSRDTLGTKDKAEQSEDPPRWRLKPDTLVLLDYLTFVSAVLAYLVALLLYFLAPQTWRHRATFPILLSPPGALLRFYLARFNIRPTFIDRFPIGTFMANIIGSLLIGGVYAAQHLPSVQAQSIRCNALWALQQGTCGCLTTVSTLVVESRSIKTKRWTWIYVGSSVVLGHLCILVTLGAASWSGSLSGSICSA